tara:strand:+ start:394 stop:645 length:252 start_codon:yes stop_codon:yes gene_type:complete
MKKKNNKWQALIELARWRKRYLQGSEYDDVRPHVNKVIVELQLLWGMTPTKAGKDVVDFFTYETAERPEWISKNKKTKQGDTQ